MKQPVIAGYTADEALQIYCDELKNGNAPHIKMIAKDSNSNDVTLDNDDFAYENALTMTTIMNPDKSLIFGKAISTEIILRILKSNKLNNVDWEQPIILSLGVAKSGSVYWVDVGKFYGNMQNSVVSSSDNIIEYTGYDYVGTTDKKADDFITYITSNITFPVTVSDLYDALITHLGISGSVANSCVNGSIDVTANPFTTDDTYREIFEWFAEVCGGYAVTKGDGTDNVNIISYESIPVAADYTLTPDLYFKFEKGELQIPTVEQVLSIYTVQYSENRGYPSYFTHNPYTITDNPILLKVSGVIPPNPFAISDRETACKNILENILTYGDSDPTKPVYYPMKVDTVGNWLIETGDIVEVEDADGNVYPMRIFNRILTINGDCTDYFECTGDPSKVQNTEGEGQGSSETQIQIADNLTTTEKGLALDASQGKILQDQLDVIGTYKSNSSSGTKNFGNTTKYSGASVSLTKGVWVVHANCTINKTNSGQRSGLTITTSNSDGAYNANAYSLDVQRGSETANQYYNVAAVWNASGNITLYAMIFNGSVSTSYAASIYAVRIA